MGEEFMEDDHDDRQELDDQKESMVDDDDDDDDNEDAENELQRSKPTCTETEGRRAVCLSKSWSIGSAHVPTFTGGKVTHCFTSPESHANNDLSGAFVPFLLLPVDGDVAVVDASRGVKLGTVRGDDALNGDDDDEADGVDQEAITAYALSRNDQCIVTCTRSHIIRQYSVSFPTTTTGPPPIQLVKSWGRSGHTLPVTIMEFHSSNIFLATGSIDGTVRIWDVRGAYVTHVFRPLAGGDGGGSGRLSVTSLTWRLETSRLVLAIARDDGSITIHDLRNAADQVIVIRDHVSAVTSMAWWGKDEFFVSTGRDAILNLWRIVTTTEEENALPSMTANAKNNSKKKKKSQAQQLQLGSNDFPKVSYRRIQTLPVYEQVEGMVLVPSNNPCDLTVATAGSKGVIRLWKATVRAGQTPELKMVLEQSPTQAFHETRGGYMGLVLNESATAAAVALSGSQKELLIAVDAEHSFSFLSADLNLSRTVVGHNDEILDLKIIPPRSCGATTTTTSKVVVATNSPQIRIFELGNFSCTVLDGHSATVLCVEVSPCGRYIASCGKDKVMRIWRVMDVKDKGGRPICVATATGHTEAIGACGLSRKVARYEVGGKAAKNGGGAFAVTASLDRTLKRWNLPGVDELLAHHDDDYAEASQPYELSASVSVRGHEKDINIVSVAPNDSMVATGSQDKTVKLWKSTDLTLTATLKGHKRGIWDCQFSPIDRVLATSSGDKTIKLWSLGDYSCVRTFQGHVASVLRVRFLTGGLQLMSGGADGLLKLWTIRTNECEATLDGHSDRVWALDLKVNSENNESILVSGGADSKLIVWQDNTQQVDEDKRSKEAETIMLDQKLANHLRHKEYDKALEIALQVDKPMQALKVVTSVIENDLQQKRQNGLASLQQHVQGWTMERTTQVLKYCREWNTRALNSHVAMLVVKAIVTTIPADTLAATQGIPEILAGIVPYAERHWDRLDKLYTGSYLLDFSLDSILGCLDPTDDIYLDSEKDFEAWQAGSKLVLPPKHLDGRIQKGGKDIVGGPARLSRIDRDGSDDDDDDEVVTVGDSTSASSSDDDDDDSVEEIDMGRVGTGKGATGSGADDGSSSSSSSS
jgi:U3 small nucleolar RNA-associated protein 13